MSQLVKFIKTSHEKYTLEISKDNNLLYFKTLEAKSFLRHDLMHFIVETDARLKSSFFGDIFGLRENLEEIIITEKIVAMLQSLDKNLKSANEIYNDLVDTYKYFQAEMPFYLTQEFIEKVKKRYILMLQFYNNLKTGESMVYKFEI